MALSEEDAAALRADLQRLQQKIGAVAVANRECEAKLERLQKERSMDPFFDGQGGGGSADRGGTAATTMGPMWTRGARQQQPSRGIPTIGVGRIYDCGNNDIYFQEDSPPSPSALMCVVYRCGRYGKNGHKSEHCAAPRRFGGTCGACGQYGHVWQNCALSNRRQPHLNVFTSSGECSVTDAQGADIIVIPQQQQHHEPTVDLGGEDTPFQQSSDSIYYSNGVPSEGGGDGDAIGTGVQQQVAVAGQQSSVHVAHGSGGEGSDDDGWNSGVAEAPASSPGAASAAVPAAAPATGGTVFPTSSVGGAPASSAAAAASAEISATEPATSITVPSAASRGTVGGRESSAGAVSSDAAAEAAPSTGGTAAPVVLAARAARAIVSAAGSAGDSWVGNICGERGTSTYPFDPSTVFPLEVRYSSDERARYNGSWLQQGSSSSSNDNTSDQDSWWDATCVGALLRPFDPGKRCRRSTRRGKAVLGGALPFDRGKEWGRMQHGG